MDNFLENLYYVVSTIAFFLSIYSVWTLKKERKRNYGLIEIEIRNMINSAQMHLEEITINKLGKKLSEDDQNKYDCLIESAIERVKNVYDEACMKYLDGKVDKERFKKTYAIEIRQLVENYENDYSGVKVNYKSTVMVYEEWNNLEKNK